MKSLPLTNASLLVRTYFSDDDAWRELVAGVSEEDHMGLIATVEVIDDADFSDVSWQDLKAAVPPNDTGAFVMFVADHVAVAAPDHPILVLDIFSDRPPFRCAPDQLQSIESNLNIANMDWEDFAGYVDSGGVFRGH